VDSRELVDKEFARLSSRSFFEDGCPGGSLPSFDRTAKRRGEAPVTISDGEKRPSGRFHSDVFARCNWLLADMNDLVALGVVLVIGVAN
jgi:hypothetical protein